MNLLFICYALNLKVNLLSRLEHVYHTSLSGAVVSAHYTLILCLTVDNSAKVAISIESFSIKIGCSGLPVRNAKWCHLAKR